MFIVDEQDECEETLDKGSWDRSTRSQSKQRRDLINREINHLRELLPFPDDVRHRLSQLQLMACICVYLRKTSFFAYSLNAVQRADASRRMFPHRLHPDIPPPADFSKAINSSVLLCGQDGKILFISDNAADTMGQNLEDLLSHGDNLYDLIDRNDHLSLRLHLDPNRTPPSSHEAIQPPFNPAFPLVNTGFDYNQERTFVCRINSPRNMRRQGRFAEQKTFANTTKLVVISGTFLPAAHVRQPLDIMAPRPLEGRSFLATVDALLTADNRESFLHGVGVGRTFSTLHQLDMTLIGANRLTKAHLGYGYRRLLGMSWYQLLHWDDLDSAHAAHRLVASFDDVQHHSAMLLLRILNQSGKWVWCHAVLQLLNDRSPPLNTVASKKPACASENHLFDFNVDPVQNEPVKLEEEKKETISTRILCSYQILSDKERRVLQKNPWIYEICETIREDKDYLAKPIRNDKPNLPKTPTVLLDIPLNTPKPRKPKVKSSKPTNKRKCNKSPANRKRPRPSVHSPISPVSNEENGEKTPQSSHHHGFNWEDNENISYLNYLFQSSNVAQSDEMNLNSAAVSEGSLSPSSHRIENNEHSISVQLDDYLEAGFCSQTGSPLGETIVPHLCDSDWVYLENILTGSLNTFHKPSRPAEETVRHGRADDGNLLGGYHADMFDMFKLHDVKSENDDLLLYDHMFSGNSSMHFSM